MCEGKIILLEESGKKQLLDDVTVIRILGSNIECETISGEKSTFNDVEIQSIDFTNGDVILNKL